ncbi:MAG: response regulator [Bellilinea sp.]
MEPQKILVVDDDAAIVRLCQRILERSGYFVHTATAAKDALNSVQITSYDLMITDIRMPGMDGFELTTRIKQIQPDIAIILMTGFGSVETAIQALRRGVDGLLVKPFESSSELVGTVSLVLKTLRDKRDAARLKILHPLFEVTENIFTHTDLDLLIHHLKKICVELFQTRQSGVYRCNHDSNSWDLVFGQDLAEYFTLANLNLNDWVRRDGGSNSWVIFGEQIENPGINQFLERNGLELILVPITGYPSKYLFYFVRSVNDNKFHESDLEMAAIFSRQAAVALENAFLYRSLQESILRAEESNKALRLSEKMGALGRLMGTLAHEINNPLQAVRNCLHLAARPDITTAQQQEYLEIAIKEVERLSKLAKNTLSFYQSHEVKMINHDLLAIIDLVLELIEPQLKQYQIEVEKCYPHDPVEVKISQHHIQQVVLNLLLNAMQSLKPCSGERKIWIEVEPQAENVILSIEDNGLGVPVEFEERVFEPFFSTREGGTGLGLSISYELVVDVHRGELRFIPPKFGQGARIRMTVPRQGVSE